MPNYPYENDRSTIPDSMDKNIGKYDIGDEIQGKFNYTVDKKDAKDIILCIKSLSCKPQVRMKSEKEY